MRLIDADALLENYNLKNATKYGNKDAEQQRHSYDTMMMYEIADMIENAPTAYDVNKVVEQIRDVFERTLAEILDLTESKYTIVDFNVTPFEDRLLGVIRSGDID